MRHRSESLRDPRSHVVRRFAPGNLAIGVVALVGAVAMLYLFWSHPVRKLPIVALPLAATMIAGGFYLLARPFADACAACGRTLVIRIVRASPEALATATAALRSVDVGQALEALAPAGASGAAHAELRYCRSCGSAAVWKGADAPVVLGGERAQALIAGLLPPDPADDARE